MVDSIRKAEGRPIRIQNRLRQAEYETEEAPRNVDVVLWMEYELVHEFIAVELAVIVPEPDRLCLLHLTKLHLAVDLALLGEAGVRVSAALQWFDV